MCAPANKLLRASVAREIADAVSHLVSNPVVNLLVSALRLQASLLSTIACLPGSDGTGIHHAGLTHFHVEAGSNNLYLG